MKRILIPTDFSESSVNSIIYGFRMAGEHNIKVILIHVIELYKYAAGTSESEIYTNLSSEDRTASFKKKAEEAFEKLLQSIKEKIGTLPSLEIKISSGNLLNELQKEVDSGHVILTIIAASLKGKKGYLPTTNYNILNKLRCPVMLIPQNAAAKPIRKIVYGASIVPADLKAIEKLTEHADQFNSDIVIATIYSGKNDFMQELAIRGFQDVIFDSLKDHHKIQFVRLNEKNVISGLEKISLKENADILVMLKKKKSLLTSIINKSNAERLAFNLRIPIMYYHEIYLE